MTLIYMSPRPPHATWQQWALALGLTIFAAVVLRTHIYYLNHLHANDWGWRYLQVNRNNGEFLEKLHRFKLVIGAGWMGALGFSYYYCRLCLRVKGMTPNGEMMARMIPALVVFLFSVVNYDPPDIELGLYFFVNSVGVAAAVYGLYRMPYLRLPLMVLGQQAMRLKYVPNLALCAAAFGFIFLLSHYLGAIFFSHMPLTVDSSAQLVHAKMMLKGGWSMPSHPLRAFFDMYMMINNGRWYSQYPPGHVMLLALGTMVKMRSYVNPLLGGMTALVIYRMALELYGVRVARIAVMLAGGCVYMILMSSEFMSNATALLVGTLFLWAYFRMLKRPHWKTALWGGIAIGYCFITRPYSALALSMPYIIYSIYLLLAQPKVFLRPLLVMAGGASCFVLFQLYYNWATTGHALTFGYELSWGQWHNPLTHEAANRLDESELFKNFRENLQRSGWFNRMVFEWPIPAMFLLIPAWAWRGGRLQERLLFMTLLSYFLSCAVLPGNVEREWGPRLWYELLGVVVILCARALSLMPAFFRIMCKRRHSLAYYYGFAVVIGCLFLGFGYKHNMQPSVIMNIYNFYGRGNNPGLYKFIVRNAKTPALVFMTGDTYQAVSFTNPPTESSPIIFVYDMGGENGKMMRHYPERKAYRASITRDGYRLEQMRRKP